MTPSPAPDLLVPEELLDAELATRGWSESALRAGEMPVSFHDFQVQLINADPALWVERNLRDKETETPWRLWDYQRRSIRYAGNTVHKCAAEVGKTREIVGRVLWRFATMRGEQLVGAALDGHLEKIWLEVRWQCNENPMLLQLVDWRATHKAPYRQLVSVFGDVVDFRMAGTEGEPFRGCHPNLGCYMDEGYLVKSKQAWGNFFSRARPRCPKHLYSTPDGDTLCEMARIAASALPSEAVIEGGLDPGARYVLFQWSKELMPPPYWTEERRQAYVEEYGGEDSAEYQQNVLGRDGDPVATVFPREMIEPCRVEIPGYRALKLLADSMAGLLRVGVYDGTMQEAGTELPLADLHPTAEATTEALVELLEEILGDPPEGDLVVGADLGWTQDPLEISVHQVDGEVLRWALRIRAQRFKEDLAERLFEAVDRWLGFPLYGWGADATSGGRVICRGLHRQVNDHYWEDRLSAYQLHLKITEIDEETGEEVIDRQTEKPRRIRLKEWATQLLTRRMNRGQYEISRSDVEILQQFVSHTAKKGASGERIFDKRNDHLVDTARVAVLRFDEIEKEGLGYEAPVVRSSGRRRESLDL